MVPANLSTGMSDYYFPPRQLLMAMDSGLLTVPTANMNTAGAFPFTYPQSLNCLDSVSGLRNQLPTCNNATPVKSTVCGIYGGAMSLSSFIAIGRLFAFHQIEPDKN